MRVEARLLLGLGTFFGIMMVVYWFWSHENAGSVMMFAGMLLCFLPGSYYYYWSRRMKPRAEDDPHATQASGAGVVGTFPGTSIWPFTLGMGAFFVALALVFGIWLLVPGLGLVFWAVVGGTAEGRRGGHH
ncbi:MAG: cytochrome c oxidase subunit 4 [Acidimicrobiales bacterium]